MRNFHTSIITNWNIIHIDFLIMPFWCVNRFQLSYQRRFLRFSIIRDLSNNFIFVFMLRQDSFVQYVCNSPIILFIKRCVFINSSVSILNIQKVTFDAKRCIVFNDGCHITPFIICDTLIPYQVFSRIIFSIYNFTIGISHSFHLVNGLFRRDTYYWWRCFWFLRLIKLFWYEQHLSINAITCHFFEVAIIIKLKYKITA